MNVDVECPRCGCRRVELQVIAWWKFDDGHPQAQGDDYMEPAHDAHAICEECGEMWTPAPATLNV